MIYQARTENSEMFIAMYEEYRVRDEDKQEIEQSILVEFCLKEKYIWETVSINDELFLKTLEKGIDCTFLKDRLKFCVDCTNNICQGECGMCDKMEKMWTLLPLEDKKENEAWPTDQEIMFEAKRFANTFSDDNNEITEESFIQGIKWFKSKIFKNPNKQ